MAFIIDDLIMGLLKAAIALLSLIAQVTAGVIGIATRDEASMLMTVLALMVLLYFLWWEPQRLPDTYAYIIPVK